MTTYKNWAVAAAIALTILLAGVALFGYERPAHADNNPIVTGVFCFLNGLPTTDVFTIGTNCSGDEQNPPELTVIKHVDNTDGGSAQASDFTMQVTGTNVSNASFPGAEAPGTTVTLDPGSYSVSEASGGPANYVESTNGACSGSIAAGQSLTCTITNTYTPPKPSTGILEVKKVIVGGPSVSPDNFSFQVTASNDGPGSDLPFDPSGTSDMGVSTGQTYSIAEVASSTYTTTYSNSQNGNADCNALAVTQDATTTCTITNTYITPTPGPSCTIVSDTNTTDSTDGHPAVLVSTINPAWTATSNPVAFDPAAKWIWSEDPISDTVDTVTKDFTRTFNIVGTPTNASIDIGADNGFVLKVNGTTVEDASTTENNFSASQHFDITSDLVTGDNTVEVDVTNFGVAGSDSSSNPAGTVFQINLPDNDCGTPGNNGGGGSEPTNVTQTIVVKPSNMQNWAFIDDTTNGAGTGSMVFGPSPVPLGNGSAQLTATSSTDGQILATATDLGVKLSDLSKLTYETYQATSNPSTATAIALQFNVTQDVTNTGLGWQGRIVYEPYLNNGGTVPQGAWTTWDALNSGNAKWWFSKPASFGGNCPQASPCTLSSIIALYPNIGISPTLGGVVLKAGSGWTSFEGNVDNLIIGTTDGTNSTTTTYDFEPNVSDVAVTKSADKSTPNVGDTITYTITASDSGDDATGVVISDLLPSGLTFVSTSSSDTVGIYDPISGNWTIGALSSTTPAVLHIMATVNNSQENGTVITNTATVASGDTSNDPDNNSGSASVTVTIPTTPNNGGGGGGGGGGGNGPIPGTFGGGNGPIGQVLGASTSTVPGSCTQYLTGFIRLGAKNDPEQVTRLQAFLDQFEGATLPITGVYDQATYQAVKAFQQKYASDVLTPWGENAPTGYVYLTTRREINIIYCNYTLQFPLTPAQIQEIQNYKTGGVGGGTNGGQQSSTTGGNNGTNTPNTQNSTQDTTQQNPNLGEAGAAGFTEQNGSFWENVKGFFSKVFHF